MIAFANCKINLGLKIHSKRVDGYHNLETIFLPVAWYDIIEIIPSKKSNHFSFSGIPINDTLSNNTCYKAYQLVKQRYDIPDIRFHLHKTIPFGAGLGGGSSDAAFTLKILNSLFNLELNSTELKQMAASIGADCPFFIDNIPSIARGIGELLQPININLNDYYIVIAKPDFAISTKEAYQNVKPNAHFTSLSEQVVLPIDNWKNSIHNDFEQALHDKYPKIEEIKQWFYENGAIYASLSGSGSAVYGIFEQKSCKLRSKDFYLWHGKLCDSKLPI